MKAIFNEWAEELVIIQGKPLVFNLDTSNEDIVRFIKSNLSEFDLNEEWSCSVELEDNIEIVIRGDEDLKRLAIETLNPIL